MYHTNHKLLTQFALCLLVLTTSACSNHTKTKHESHQHATYNSQSLPVVILGGGIAGLTSALYCAQANIPCLVIEGPKPGGALSQSHSVRNWPGVINAPGADIVGALRKQVTTAGVKIVQETVTAVDFTRHPFAITSTSGQETESCLRKANACIIAMGTEPNYLNIPGERGANGYWGKGITNCAVCEGSLCKGKNVAVVGGGDAAMVEAGYLADIAAHVTVFVRGKHLRAKDEKTKSLTLNKPNVSMVYATQVIKASGDGKHLTHLATKNTATGKEASEEFDALFLAIGSRPNTSLFKGQLDLDEHGFIKLTDHQAASIPGVFAAGDICDHLFVQAITAAGQGCMATLQAKKFLESIGFQAEPITADADNSQETAPSKPSIELKKTVQSNDLVKEIKTTKDFETLVLGSKKPVVIDLFSTWCIPCQNMMPIVHKMADEFSKSIAFVKMNVANKDLDLTTLLAKIHGASVMSVPTFLFIRNGKEVNRAVGSMDSSKFRKLLRSF